jgi:putative sigma-54 modulation protein
MQVTVSGRHTPVSQQVREVATDKVGRLERYLQGMDRAEVHFWEESTDPDAHTHCEVTMEGRGHHVVAKVSAPDPVTAIDLVVERLEAQLRTIKGKDLIRRHGR